MVDEEELERTYAHKERTVEERAEGKNAEKGNERQEKNKNSR